MNQLHGACHANSSFGRRAHGLGAGQRQQRSHALATTQDGVAHGLGKACGHLVLGGHPALQCLLDQGQLNNGPSAQIKGLVIKEGGR